MCYRNPYHCIIPPYIIENLAQSENPEVRAEAITHLSVDATVRAFRQPEDTAPNLIPMASPNRQRLRLIYDAQHTGELPGILVRAEGQDDVSDAAVDEAYHFSGDAYDFYNEIFQRNSLDNEGMALISSVHPIRRNNAFWTGTQMVYGDGDGYIFRRFTRALDVIGHELTHGVQQFTSSLHYYGQSGTLNEHFSDVFGVLIRQWRNGETAADANWVVGAEILVPAPTRRGIRDMENPGTAYDDPYIGTDPQPAHISQIYEGDSDRGGVHINSGIPNRAFVLTSQALGGSAWDVAGWIWYKTMLTLPQDSQFIHCAEMTVEVAEADYGAEARAAVRAGWAEVGIQVE
jgi:Zn-dependent metalloprotease